MSQPLLRSFVVVSGFFLVAGLSVASLQAKQADRELQRISDELHKQLTVSLSRGVEPDLDKQHLLEFYEGRDFYPVWVNRSGPLYRAQLLRQRLLTADQDGLDVMTYHPDFLAPLWNSRSSAKLARLELLLTDAFFRYSVHLRAGQFQENDFYWDIEAAEVDPVSELRGLLTASDFRSALQGLTPSHAGYLRLREALKIYRQIEKDGGWPLIPPGPLLKAGSWHEQVAIVRQRLIAEGDLELGPVRDARYFDDAVKFAVERFQVRHGLKVDGIVGPATRIAANITVGERIRQIRFNMERWRWLPKQLGQRYIMVNTADFNLAVVEHEDVLLTMGVIVGRPDRPTPVTSSEIRTVVFNPYWTLPPTIIFEDVLPLQKRDPTYFKSKQIRVFSDGKELDSEKIDWSRLNRNYFPYILRQDPGPGNSLGRLKFLFSNSYTVYLHDTPDKHLFNKDTRALSSGCIRVAKPVALASYLLGRGNGWTAEKIQAVIESGEHRKVPLPETVPVYLIYMTSWVAENRGVHFRPDIYERDPKRLKCDELPKL